uniref:Ovule protein n=1 Tax=Angiostrongylus cantonensis TaxID=6313 RepID=A0A0K0DD88_ANGCA
MGEDNFQPCVQFNQDICFSILYHLLYSVLGCLSVLHRAKNWSWKCLGRSHDQLHRYGYNFHV